MTRFDVEAFIDRSRIGATQAMALFVCILVCFIDGYDIFMIGKIAPAIAAGFGEPSEAMAPLFVYQQIGLAVGAFTISPLADRFGRRAMLIFTCLTFGIITLLSVYAQTLTQLAILRGIGGIFMAAGLGMSMAMISEITPKRRRSTFIAVALAGYSMGSASSGVVAAWLLDDFGWQSAFWIGGLVPLICVPLLILFVPESLKFRAERNPSDRSIAKTLRRIDPSVELRGDELFVIEGGETSGRKARLSDVFSEGRLAMTTVIWLACAISMTNTALMSAWLPTFFQEMAGVPIQEFAKVALIAYMGGVVGTLCIGWLMDRLPATMLLAFFYFMLAGALISLSWVPFHSGLFIVVALAWSFFQTGGQGGINTMIAQVYPPRMRSTALGWAGGAGRIGGILAPLGGAFALAQHYSLQLTMTFAATLPICVALLMLLLGLVMRGRRFSDGQPAQA
ncbi:MFS transporter [Sphingobium lignivorans]|uniref:AAHS family 4-hydroxybenzoate transporter-like MFS transporter n=1 Tax=Sphingobium lignivorans TaxID=2735886 RepID=A0ABR6NCE1_9SPHN|nr:MFS transporter [Sphingobium lignivorans]MBB5984946.1 AAHS family 4-hydroxybenzoate transporter-like MFS transporter [Sphingobium lignivorans]